LKSMVDPVTTFFAETNDAKKNDATSTVPPEITAALMDMGAFGLCVITALYIAMSSRVAQ
jgi:hypothetical protein